MRLSKWKEYFTIYRSGYFDASYYLLKNPDVRLKDIDPLRHFIEYGWKEGRDPSLYFDTTYYLEANPDVRQAGINPLIHYLKYGYKEGRRPHPHRRDLAVKKGKTENPRRFMKWRNIIYRIGKYFYYIIPIKFRGRWLYWSYQHLGFLFRGFPHYENWRRGSLSSPSNALFNGFLVNLDEVQPVTEVKGSIAIHLHIFYSDVIREFFDLLTNMPFPYDLYISSPFRDIVEQCEHLYKNLPHLCKLKVELVENRGRNFAPLLCTFGEELSCYDFIAHLHSKKSLYNKGATQGWREYLSHTLLGDEQQIRKIFSLLQKDEPYGIVYPQNYHLLPYWANTWLANEPLAREWGSRIGLTSIPRGYFDYPAGSMFWARVEALAPLFNARITLGDFPEEAGQTDGTLAHVLERFLALCTLEQGWQPAIIADATFPSWSSWRLEQYINRPYESIIELLTKPTIKLIAFDIFDTLILRPLINPETIKEIVAREVGDDVGNLYRQFRVVAEQQARDEKGKDVTLDEIYTQFAKITNLSLEVVSSLKQLEERIEISLAEPRPSGIELYRQALSTGKPVILISDMFLSKKVIEECLRKVGIDDWHSIYLSGEIGMRKDSGELYRYVLDRFNIRADEMLMIGDNERSDVQIPCDMGANFIHLMRPVELTRGLPRWKSLINHCDTFGSIEDEITLGLVIRNNFCFLSFPDFDPFTLVSVDAYTIGYSLVGPLLVSFVSWLVDQAQEDGVDHLYFLSREGSLLKQVYDLWCEDKDSVPISHYLILSRRAASVAAITSREDIFSIARVEFYPNPLESFLYIRFGLDLDNDAWIRIERELGWNRNQIIQVQNEDIANLVPLLTALEDEISNRAVKEREGLLHYLTENQLEVSKKPAVVDIGYGGSVQGYLNKLTGQYIHGYYLLTNDRADKMAQMYNVLARGCFYENLKKASNMPSLYRYSFYLEKLLTINEPQIQYYEQQPDGTRKSIYRNLNEEEITSNEVLKRIHEGVIDFAKEAITIRQTLRDFRPSIRISRLLIEEFLSNLSSKEESFLSKIIIDDYYCGRGLV